MAQAEKQKVYGLLSCWVGNVNVKAEQQAADSVTQLLGGDSMAWAEQQVAEQHTGLLSSWWGASCFHAHSVLNLIISMLSDASQSWLALFINW